MEPTVTAGVFIWPGLALAAYALWVVVVAPLIDRYRREVTPARQRPALVDPSYNRKVRTALPDAWRAAGLKPTPARALPSTNGAARALGDGIEIPLTFGGYNASDLVKLEERVAGALQRDVAVGLVRIRPTPGQPGRGTLVVARTHPLAAPVVWPAAYGRRAPGGKEWHVCIGRTEFLRPATVDLSMTSAWFGQNGSGKTVGVVCMMLAAATMPNVELTIYDGSLKGGSGYVDFGARLLHGRPLRSKAEIVADMRQTFASLTRRAELLNGKPWQATRALPLRVKIIEEFPALELEDDDLELLIKLVRQGREFGLAAHLVSQNPAGYVVDTGLRAELRQRMVYRVDGWRMADMGLGEGTRGSDGEDGYVPIPVQWPGVFDSVVKEETGVIRSRTFMPTSTMAEAEAWATATGLDAQAPRWRDDPKAVALARMRAFIRAHVEACPSAPVAGDIVPLRQRTQTRYSGNRTS